jgi:hypothetical protein
LSSLIEGPFADGETVRFWQLAYPDGMQKRAMIEIAEGRMTVIATPQMILGTGSGHSLRYDRGEGSLAAVAETP